MQEMFESALSGARTDEVEGVTVVVQPALTAGAADVLAADGYLPGTPANIGYISPADRRGRLLTCSYAAMQVAVKARKGHKCVR